MNYTKLTFTGIAALGGLPAVQAADPRPNIVLMIADDCTYRDLQCYGSPNSTTPNINRLAEEGMKFNNFFQATAMSSPTRHCLMTGLYPIRSGAYPNHTMVNKGVKSVVQYLRQAGYRVALQGKRHIWPPAVFDFEYLGSGGEDVNTDLIKPFIEDAKEKGQPFCLFVCSHQPHIPWNKGDVSVIDPDKLELPSYFVDTPETRADFQRYQAEVNYMDGQVGDVCRLLRSEGVEDNTVFFFTSEQGNSMPFAKYTCYDMGLHTGMIVRWPGVIEPGSTCDAMAEYVDVTPTMIDIAGGAPVENLDGRSFRKLLTGEQNDFKTEVYGVQTTRGTNKGSEYYAIRSICDGRYIYIRNLTPEVEFRSATTDMEDPLWRSWVERARTDKHAATLVKKYYLRPAEELYDREKDPDQLHNLAKEKKYAEIKKNLSYKLSEWMKSQGDRGQATEMEAIAHQNPGRQKKDPTPWISRR